MYPTVMVALLVSLLLTQFNKPDVRLNSHLITAVFKYSYFIFKAVFIRFAVVKPNQIRCGEHSDYGSITLLFQDDAGGLEVMYCLFFFKTRVVFDVV